MQKHSNLAWRNIEALETRCLLAADLVVQVDPLIRDGDEGTSFVRIFNNGDRDARNVEINSRLSDQFVDTVWQRERGFAQVVRHDTDAPPGLGARIGAPTRDINGDGLDDFVVRTLTGSAIVWGGL